MESVRFGVIGCGAIAKRHAEAISGIPEARLVACFDVVEDNARVFASRYGGRVCGDYRGLLDDPEVDAVIVATPSGLHACLGMEALDSGKHVLVEKPLALSPVEVRRLIEKANEAGRCLGTVHPNRYYPASRMVHSAVQEGRLGRLSHGVATVRLNRTQAYYDEAPWRKSRDLDGGVLFNQAWHAMDMLVWLMGPVSDAHKVAACRAHEMEAEDVAILTMRFESGALGLVEATTNIYPKNLEQSIAVFGETGAIILGGSRVDAIRLWRLPDDDEKAVLDRFGESAPPGLGPGWAHAQAVLEFVRQVRSGETGASDEARTAVELARLASGWGMAP
ncbi:MAG: Gfo/Idh/MocA family oxidoreductase [Firmicutes bacterium]|nr:Gfo/Idh/MocA family oxidoreductase [Bacillota bacterium]